MSDNPKDALDIFTDGPPSADWTLILAPGAGQGMDSSFMTYIADTLGRAGPGCGWSASSAYMVEIRRTGNRKAPDRESVLLERWNLVIDRELAVGTDARRLLIGGKYLGGRMSSLIADERGVAGLVCLGYPFHPAVSANTRSSRHQGNANRSLRTRVRRAAQRRESQTRAMDLHRRTSSSRSS
jgi:predicted alpha/beta-hydrolase family hydrolase